MTNDRREDITTMLFTLFLAFLVFVVTKPLIQGSDYFKKQQAPTPTVIVEFKTAILPTISVTMPTFPGKGQPVVTAEPTKTLGGSFKSYMDYRKITNKESDQFALQKIATTDKEGFRRVGRYFCIAMGTHYAEYIGQTFIIELEHENLDCIVADIKDDKDTIDGTYCKENGSIIEFVVDKEKLSEKMLVSGNILKFMGQVLSIESEGD